MTQLTKSASKLHARLLATIKKIEWFPPLLARVSVGSLFAATGWGKLHHLPQVEQFFREIGIPAPAFHAPFVATNEFLCGLMITAGLLTRFACIPLSITMVVALATAKKGDISSLNDLFGLPEYLFLLILIGILFSGPGMVSIDELLKRRFASKKKK